MDEWRTIEEFPMYSVSNRGLVFNEKAKRIMGQSINQTGVVLVGLSKEGRQHKRSVALLVANAFLKKPASERFNTVIHLDGNHGHNFEWNLRWRPRPFAVAYHRQFKAPYSHRINKPIREVETGVVFANSFDAAIQYGLLERAVVISALDEEGTTVFPTGQQFCLIKK